MISNISSGLSLQPPFSQIFMICVIPCPEKLCMIFNKSVLKVFTGKGSIIADDFVIVVISQLKIGIIKNLIIFYVPEQFQIVIAVEALRDFLLYKPDTSFSNLSRIASANPINIRVICVECGSVQSGVFANIRYADFIQLFVWSNSIKTFSIRSIDSFFRLLFGVFINKLLYLNTC